MVERVVLATTKVESDCRIHFRNNRSLLPKKKLRLFALMVLLIGLRETRVTVQEMFFPSTTAIRCSGGL